MTIALFSDIHANLPALNAFFLDVEKHKPDAIYCLGDLVGYNVWPNEVIEEIRRRGIATIAGNHDLKVDSMGNGNAAVSVTGKNYAYDIIGTAERAYLRKLPSHLRVMFQLNDDLFTLLMVHGSPRSANEYLFEEIEEAALVDTMTAAKADILCFGHTHKPYCRTISSVENGVARYLYAINTGSIGKPKDDDPRGSYVLLHIDEKSSAFCKDTIKAEIIRFEYDVETAARGVEESPLPQEFADMLRKAY
jgi:putative phosphoesterase